MGILDVLSEKKKEVSAEGYWKIYHGRSIVGIFAGFVAIIGFLLFIRFFNWLLFALLGIGSFICLLICMDYMTYGARKEMKDKYEQLLKEKKEDEYLFSIDTGLEDDLNKNLVSERLEDEFKTKGFPLSKDVNVTKKKDGKWMITDKGKEETYIVEKEKGKLNIYKKEKQEEEGKYELFMNYVKTLPLADRIAIIHPEPVGVFDHHEIRRSLTISLTIVYFALLSLSVFKLEDLLIKDNPMIELFTWIYLTVIAFYFGSRGLEKYAEVKISKKEEEEKQKEENGTESKGSVKPQISSKKPEDTIPVGQELKWSQEFREWFKLIIGKTKSSEDIKKLLQTIEGLPPVVEKIKNEFDEFKAEISDRVEKLEESVGAMRNDHGTPKNNKKEFKK